MREPTREEWHDWTLAIEEKPKPDKCGSGFFANLMQMMFPQRQTPEQVAQMNAATQNQANLTCDMQKMAAAKNIGWSALSMLMPLGGRGVYEPESGATPTGGRYPPAASTESQTQM